MKGPKFCPTTRGNFIHKKADSKEFTRKLKLMEKFHDIQSTDISLVKGKSFHEVRTKNKELSEIVSKIESCEPVSKEVSSNLTNGEKKALSDIKNFEDVVIKKADKGNVLVVMDSSFYREKLVLKDHLNTSGYTKVNDDSDESVVKDLATLLDRFEKCLTKKEHSYMTNADWQSSNFYVLPKIHKCQAIKEAIEEQKSEYVTLSAPNDLKGRPIVAGPNCPTKRLSELLDQILKPLVPQLKSYVKDDWDVLRKLPRTTDGQCELVSCDVVSLYTSIPHDLGLEALKYWLQKSRHIVPSRFTDQFILAASAFVLKNNYFNFDNQLWLQLIGTAMGTNFAPAYACLTMGYLEETKLKPQLLRYFTVDQTRIIIENFIRYIDDGFILWLKDMNLERFKSIMNNLHPSIKWTFELGETVVLRSGEEVKKLNLLDILILLYLDGRIETDIFYKDTNTHDYLLYNSHHPEHVKNNIPFTLAKKIIVFCSSQFVEERLSELRTSLLACKYPPHIIDKGIHCARLQGPANDPSKKTTPLPFVTTYSSNLDSKRILTTARDLLSNVQDDRLKDIFSGHSPLLALKQPPNLLRQISSAEYTSSPTAKIEDGLFKCEDKKCKLCRLYIQQCKSFRLADGSEWTIKGNVTCHSKCVLYYLVCLFCNGDTSKTGKTNKFRTRMNNHISECNSGATSDLFDLHVHQCMKDHGAPMHEGRFIQPYFKVYVYFEVSEPKLLIPYEDHLHSKNFDTINNGKQNKRYDVT